MGTTILRKKESYRYLGWPEAFWWVYFYFFLHGVDILFSCLFFDIVVVQTANNDEKFETTPKTFCVWGVGDVMICIFELLDWNLIMEILILVPFSFIKQLHLFE